MLLDGLRTILVHVLLQMPEQVEIRRGKVRGARGPKSFTNDAIVEGLVQIRNSASACMQGGIVILKPQRSQW